MNEFYNILNGKYLGQNGVISNATLASGKIVFSDGSTLRYLGGTPVISLRGDQSISRYVDKENANNVEYILSKSSSELIQTFPYIININDKYNHSESDKKTDFIGGESTSILYLPDRTCISNKLSTGNLTVPLSITVDGNMTLTGNTSIGSLDIKNPDNSPEAVLLKSTLKVSESSADFENWNTSLANVTCKNKITLCSSEDLGFEIRDESMINWSESGINKKVALYATSLSSGFESLITPGKLTVVASSNDTKIGDISGYFGENAGSRPNVGNLDGIYVPTVDNKVEYTAAAVILTGELKVDTPESSININGDNEDAINIIFSKSASGDAVDVTGDLLVDNLWGDLDDPKIEGFSLKNLPEVNSVSKNNGTVEMPVASDIDSVTVNISTFGSVNINNKDLTLTNSDNSFKNSNGERNTNVTITSKSLVSKNGNNIASLAEETHTPSSGETSSLKVNENVDVEYTQLSSNKWAKDTMFTSACIGTYVPSDGGTKDSLRYMSNTETYQVDIGKLKEYGDAGRTHFLFAKAGSNSSQQFEFIESDSNSCSIDYSNNICRITINGEFYEHDEPTKLNSPVVTYAYTTSGTTFTVRNPNSGSGNRLVYALNGDETEYGDVSGNGSTASISFSNPGDSVKFYFKGDGINTLDSDRSAEQYVYKKLSAPYFGDPGIADNGDETTSIKMGNSNSVSVVLSAKMGTTEIENWNIAANSALSTTTTNVFQRDTEFYFKGSGYYLSSDSIKLEASVPIKLKTPTVVETSNKYCKITNNSRYTATLYYTIENSSSSTKSTSINPGGSIDIACSVNTKISAYVSLTSTYGVTCKSDSAETTINVYYKQLTVSEKNIGATGYGELSITNPNSRAVKVYVESTDGTPEYEKYELTINSNTTSSQTVKYNRTYDVYLSGSSQLGDINKPNAGAIEITTTKAQLIAPTITSTDNGNGTATVNFKNTNSFPITLNVNSLGLVVTNQTLGKNVTISRTVETAGTITATISHDYILSNSSTADVTITYKAPTVSISMSADKKSLIGSIKNNNTTTERYFVYTGSRQTGERVFSGVMSGGLTSTFDLKFTSALVANGLRTYHDDDTLLATSAVKPASDQLPHPSIKKESRYDSTRSYEGILVTNNASVEIILRDGKLYKSSDPSKYFSFSGRTVAADSSEFISLVDYYDSDETPDEYWVYSECDACSLTAVYNAYSSNVTELVESVNIQIANVAVSESGEDCNHSVSVDIENNSSSAQSVKVEFIGQPYFSNPNSGAYQSVSTTIDAGKTKNVYPNNDNRDVYTANKYVVVNVKLANGDVLLDSETVDVSTMSLLNISDHAYLEGNSTELLIESTEY